MNAYPTITELVAQAPLGAQKVLAAPKGVRKASTVYVTEQTQRMFTGRVDRFRSLVTAAPPQRWIVRDSDLQPAERVLMSAPWSAATSVDALVDALLASACTCGHPKAAHGADGCAIATETLACCAPADRCRSFTALSAVTAGATGR